VTADYAKGSSGGPVVNEAGKVVGMVSNTQSIYYGPRGKDGDQQGPLQMVVKNCVPVKAVRVMIKAREGAASRR
jgi:S1-C subfamily serine protease